MSTASTVRLLSVSPQTGVLTRLSEQALVDCSWGYGNNGCDGGESERAYQWMIDNGCIPSSDSYGGGRYLMEVNMCDSDCILHVHVWGWSVCTLHL